MPLDWREWLVTVALGAASLPISLMVRLAGRAWHRRQHATRHQAQATTAAGGDGVGALELTKAQAAAGGDGGEGARGGGDGAAGVDPAPAGPNNA